MAALKERGARILHFNGPADTQGFEELRRLFRQSDAHVILTWLKPREMMSFYPILRDRKNFSIVVDDWWIYPSWFTRNAEYVINRMYNGVAVKLGLSKFVTESPQLLTSPVPLAAYTIAASLLRLPALISWPIVDAFRILQNRAQKIRPDRLLYFPFAIVPETLPLNRKEIKYDFALNGSVTGVWLMRDVHASFKYTFANLYYDRARLTDLIASCEGNPYKIYDWRRLPNPRPPRSWDDYVQTTLQSRFIISTGGFHNAGLPKFLEYACLGTPMIGRKPLFEYPWLDDCLFEVDVMRLSTGQMKPLLDKVIDHYPTLKENCLKWREKLFQLHNIHALFDMLQAQADGQPIPPEYLRAGVSKTPHP
jgi:hypothetical protein